MECEGSTVIRPGLRCASSGVRTIPCRVRSKNHETPTRWETQHNGDDHKSNSAQMGISKRRKNLRHDLNQRHRHDCVRDCDAIHSSSLQFRKKVFQLHGSIRIGSKPRICSSVGNGNFEIYYPISAGFRDWAPPAWRSRSTFENADRCAADPIPSDVSDR